MGGVAALASSAPLFASQSSAHKQDNRNFAEGIVEIRWSRNASIVPRDHS